MTIFESIEEGRHFFSLLGKCSLGNISALSSSVYMHSKTNNFTLQWKVTPLTTGLALEFVAYD